MTLTYWSDEEDNLLKSLYAKKCPKKDVLLAFPTRTYAALKYRARFLGIKKTRLQTKNEKFFEQPNLENAAIAGILASDGNVKKPIGRNGYTVTICLATKDIQLLNDILKTVQSNAIIRNTSVKKVIKASPRNHNTEPKEYFASWISFSNAKKWMDDLYTNWNITPNKSLTLLHPNTTDLKQNLAFLSGLIDGDGSVGVQKIKNKNYLHIRLLGTKSILDWAKNIFEQSLKEKIKGVVGLERPEANVYKLQINGLQATKLHKIMYALPIIRLKRKWENPQVMEIIQNHRAKDFYSLGNFLNNYHIDFIQKEDYLDIPSKNFVIRVVHLGSDNPDNAQSKFLPPNSEGKRIIQIFENELINKNKIVINRLKHYLGLVKSSIYARKCQVKYISFEIKNKFLNKYHIQGQDYGSGIFLGLFYKNRLVNIMTFSKRNNDYELSRFCGVSHFNVVGGAGKLLAFFEKTYKPVHVFSFADKRWSVGNLYHKLNFKLTAEVKPSYFYFKLNEKKLFHKFGFRHKNLGRKLAHYDPTLTEWQNMKNNGWDRIWDCGLIKFEKNYLSIPSLSQNHV